MKVETIPLLSDNYGYLLLDPSNKSAVCIDPSESGPIIQRLRALGYRLSQIWLTHHHWDHVNGVSELVEAFKPEAILASIYDLERRRVPYQNQVAHEQSTIGFAGNVLKTHEVPGHTLGALAYEIDGSLFCGDTLFFGRLRSVV
ncbi:MAG: MBL fold metallo-hydrolase [Myxococcales bacterium]|nr:MAG: MBL fold metallo-hydrolase [Myxococcales bacterium]